MAGIGVTRAVATIVLALASGCGSAPAATDGVPQPVRYTVDATWSPATRSLTGAEAIELRNAGPGTMPFVWLRLYANNAIPGEADGCRHPNIAITAVWGASIARRAVSCSAVQLRFTRALEPGQRTAVGLRFTVHVPTWKALFGRSAGVNLLGRALPLLAVRDTQGWHLDPDTGTGDPAYTLAAAWRATLRVPAALEVASTGSERSSTVDDRSGLRTIVAESAHARDFGLAIGRLRSREATVDGVRVRVSTSAAYSAATAARALRHAVTALKTYTSWYGAYDAPELDVVLAPLGDDSQELPELVFSDPDRATIVHEVAHQWFYGMVGNDQYREPWLDESFASWSEEQLAPGTYPCRTARPLEAHRGGLARGMAYYEHRPDEYVDAIYRGGACTLIALEQLLGRDRLLGLLRHEVARYRQGVIHTADFLALVADADPAVARRWTALVGLP